MTKMNSKQQYVFNNLVIIEGTYDVKKQKIINNVNY